MDAQIPAWVGNFVKGPFDARAVANAVLDEADASNLALYPTSLLKVLYFGHGWHLAKFGVPLIGQPFEAWEHGPVVRVVYDQIRSLSGVRIRDRLTTFDPASMRRISAQAQMSDESLALLSDVLRAYGSFHPYELSDLTHEPGSPWTQVWEAALAGAAPGAKLDNGLIRKYFLRQNAQDVLGLA